MKTGVILSSLYNDWKSAEALFRAIDAEFARRGWKWHLVLVDDGSREAKSAGFLEGIQSFASVEIVALRRNVGHQRAIAIGLSHIFEGKPGEAVLVMDADGEDRPEDVVRLIEALAALPAPKVVFAERTRRSEGGVFRMFYYLYCFLHWALTGYKIRFGNFSIIPPQRLGGLVVDPNLWLHFAATVVSGRTPFTTIPTERGARLFGKSRLNFTSLVIHGFAAISCYNEIVGVRLILSSLGLGVVLLILIAQVLLIRLATPWAIPGWATTAAGIFCVLLSQVLLGVLALIAIAISSRKSHFFLPLQQYKIFINEIDQIR